MVSFFRKWKANLLVPAVPVTWAAMSLLGVFAGPFGTSESFSFTTRLVFWPVLIGAAILVGAFVRTLVEQVFGLRRFATQAPLLALLVTVLLAPPIYAVSVQLAGAGVAVVPRAIEVALFVFASSVSVSAIRHALSPTPDPQPARQGAQPRILARLPAEMQAPLVRLSVRDHYVDVVTTAGTTSILLRLGDAIAEAEGLPGAQVHRSHWVAASAIEGAGSVSGKFVLSLADGARVPVSKTYRAAAEAMLASRPAAAAHG